LFIAFFNQEELLEKFRQNRKDHKADVDITIYGEGYGGKMQGMSHTYGQQLRFIAFEVKIGENWLDVRRAHEFTEKMGLEFVPYRLIDTTPEAIDNEMMTPSEVAIRRCMGYDKIREGVVLRPTVELVHQNGGRIIVKHKRPEFQERVHQPKIVDPAMEKILADGQAIADEWVIYHRLEHVLQTIDNPVIENTRQVIAAMVEDVTREASGEVVMTDAAVKAIGKKTVKLFKEWLNNQIKE
jgi:hypothetical protein